MPGKRRWRKERRDCARRGCGERFWAQRKWQLYCSQRCRQIAYRERQAREREEMVERAVEAVRNALIPKEG